MELYGKLNKEKIVNDYTPLQSSTAELSIDNEKYTIQTNVRKVPNKINISMEDGKYLGSFDGSKQIDITIPTIAGKDGKQGENGLPALMLKNICTTDITPMINFVIPMEENLFNRTPVYNEYITFIWLNNSTNKSYAVSGQIVTNTIQISWGINVLSFTEITGESALVSNTGPYWAGDVATPPLRIILTNSSFNRSAIINDTFMQVVNKGVSGSVPSIVWLCTYKVSAITVDGQVTCTLVGYSQISETLNRTITKTFTTFKDFYNYVVEYANKNQTYIRMKVVTDPYNRMETHLEDLKEFSIRIVGDITSATVEGGIGYNDVYPFDKNEEYMFVLSAPSYSTYSTSINLETGLLGADTRKLIMHSESSAGFVWYYEGLGTGGSTENRKFWSEYQKFYPSSSITADAFIKCMEFTFYDV